MQDLIAAWDGESVSIHRDRETDTWMFICVHSTSLGSAAGGTRMRHYPQPTDALADGMRLSEAMSLKFACVEFPHGGGKAVIALPTPDIPQGEARRRLFHEYGAFINSLGGLYSCAPDMNTSAADMDLIAEVCPYVFCKTEAAGGSGDTAPDTAVGVLHGIRASCRYAFGSDDLAGRTVLVQGAGGVGGRLIELLVETRATVIATDIDPRRLAGLRDRGIRTVEPGAALTTECDVLAPCATGGVINARSIPDLRCRVIAGAANNQLETPADADLLRKRGIAYAPDFVINAGGVLHGGGLEEQHWTRAELDAKLAGIGDVVSEIFQRADRDAISTDAAARRIAMGRIQSAPAGGIGLRARM
ncbi:MAG TPA: Glu/Leu/Phe/Val dehydrogenase dimerization domain-containing protein [Candidatus Dormibacteraeota bacterium]